MTQQIMPLSEAIRKSAEEIALKGGSVEDCPEEMRAHYEAWTYQYWVCRFELDCVANG